MKGGDIFDQLSDCQFLKVVSFAWKYSTSAKAAAVNSFVTLSYCSWLMAIDKDQNFGIHSLFGLTEGSRFASYTEWHKKTVTFEKPNKNWKNPWKKFIDRNWTITTCLLRDCNPDYHCLKITSCRWRPPPRIQNATPSHSAEHATHTEWHKRTGTFEMRSGSERMHTWRRTTSTGRNFQTLIIWITVS